MNPGPNFGPYGLPKASAMLLMRQYALDYGVDGIRSNGVNADRVRSGLLTDAMIKDRARAKGLSETAYMSGNLLGREVLAEDVAQAFVTLPKARKTTGHIETVDGGNVAAALRQVPPNFPRGGGGSTLSWRFGQDMPWRMLSLRDRMPSAHSPIACVAVVRTRSRRSFESSMAPSEPNSILINRASLPATRWRPMDGQRRRGRPGGRTLRSIIAAARRIASAGSPGLSKMSQSLLPPSGETAGSCQRSEYVGLL